MATGLGSAGTLLEADLPEALLLGPLVDLVLGIEPVRNEEARADTVGEHTGHEGELTAASRLLDFLYKTYGRFIEAIVTDALYASGPWMTRLHDYGYGGFLVLKKANNEPLKEALALMQNKKPCEVYDDPESKEHIEFWDEDGIETLNSYKGKVRVIRAVITRPEQAPTTWCFVVVGERSRRVSRRTALKITRARWQTFPARRRSIRTTTNSRFQKLTGLMRSGTSNNGRWERGDVRLPLEAELLV